MLVKEIEELVYEYGDDLYRYCYRLTSNKELADELYQETFLKAVQLSHRLNRSGNCKSYLIGIAINIWRNQFRKKKRRNDILPETDYADYIESVTTDGSDILEDYIHKELTDKVSKPTAELNSRVIRQAQFKGRSCKTVKYIRTKLAAAIAVGCCIIGILVGPSVHALAETIFSEWKTTLKFEDGTLGCVYMWLGEPYHK